jgi:hypothetical protein
MSDDEMLPDSQRGFAPTIRGMAHSNAKVTISQHGYVIYETFVSPGAFAINDLYPTAQSGDLEAGKRERWFGADLYPALFSRPVYAAGRTREIQPERRTLPFGAEPGALADVFAGYALLWATG